MVILDNSTRWNSVLQSIRRALRIKLRIITFTHQFRKELGADALNDDDWDTLEAIAKGLQPFEDITLRLEGHAQAGHHGAIWEALPSLEYLLSKLEAGKEALVAAGQGTSPLAVCHQMAWDKLREYYDLTDNSHQIYAAATLLNPSLRKAYFDQHWATGELPSWIPVILKHIRDVWEREYRDTVPAAPPLEDRQQSMLDAFIFRRQDSIQGDEFAKYTQGTPITISHTSDLEILHWWDKSSFKTLRQWAFDMLSVPAMSAECERVFSSAKNLIVASRNNLDDDLVEANECLRSWWNRGLLIQEEH